MNRGGAPKRYPDTTLILQLSLRANESAVPGVLAYKTNTGSISWQT